MTIGTLPCLLTEWPSTTTTTPPPLPPLPSPPSLPPPPPPPLHASCQNRKHLWLNIIKSSLLFVQAGQAWHSRKHTMRHNYSRDSQLTSHHHVPGPSVWCLALQLHLRCVRGNPGPHHIFCHWMANQQCCDHLQVIISLTIPFISDFITNYKESEELFYSTSS